MGVKITIICDICHEEDTTYTWGEDPRAHGWEVNRNYCLCDACNTRSAANPDEEHQDLADRRELVRQANMVADAELAA